MFSIIASSQIIIPLLNGIPIAFKNGKIEKMMQMIYTTPQQLKTFHVVSQIYG